AWLHCEVDIAYARRPTSHGATRAALLDGDRQGIGAGRSSLLHRRRFPSISVPFGPHYSCPRDAAARPTRLHGMGENDRSLACPRTAQRVCCFHSCERDRAPLQRGEGRDRRVTSEVLTARGRGVPPLPDTIGGGSLRTTARFYLLGLALMAPVAGVVGIFFG